MASTLTAKRGVVFPYVVKLFPQSGSEWLASPTLASGDFKITRYTSAGTYVDGPTNLANLPTVNPTSSGNVLLLLSTTETQQGILMVEWKDQAGAEWGSGALEIHTTADDFDDVVTVTDGMTLADNAITAAKIASDAITAAKIADGAIDAATFAADAITAIASAVWAYTIESGHSALRVFRLMAAAMLGKTSGGGTTSVKFRDLNDTKDQITATVDTNGNRTSVTRDGN